MVSFDITFTHDPTALGGFLEYRRVLPTAPPGSSFSPWEVDTSIGLVGFGYFTFTGNPMTITVNGNAPHYQPNTVYQFRIRQLCADGITEILSPIDGDYYDLDCSILSPSLFIDNKSDVAAGGPGIDISWYHLPESSILEYRVMIITVLPDTTEITTYISPAIPLSQIDITGSNPNHYILNNQIVPQVFQGGFSYKVKLIVDLVTSTGYITDICSQVGLTFPVICQSYNVITGDRWGLQWMDCTGIIHECFNVNPYDTGVNNDRLIRICSLATPSGYYCEPNVGLIPGFLGANVGQGAQVTVASNASCLPGYNDYPTGLEDSNGVPLVCCDFADVTNICTCLSGPSNLNTYQINTYTNWAISWTDRNGVARMCYSTGAYNAPYDGISLPSVRTFFIASSTPPIGYWCDNGTLYPWNDPINPAPISPVPEGAWVIGGIGPGIINLSPLYYRPTSDYQLGAPLLDFYNNPVPCTTCI